MKNKDSNRLTVETTRPLSNKNSGGPKKEPIIKKVVKKDEPFQKYSGGPRKAPIIKVVKKPN
jgi:hypothetical protein